MPHLIGIIVKILKVYHLADRKKRGNALLLSAARETFGRIGGISNVPARRAGPIAPRNILGTRSLNDRLLDRLGY